MTRAGMKVPVMKTHFAGIVPVHTRRFILLATPLIFLSGCSDREFGPMANKSNSQALSFKPPAGQSGVYAIRPSTLRGGRNPLEIILDADQLGKITSALYLYATVPPGEHSLQARGVGFNASPLETEEG